MRPTKLCHFIYVMFQIETSPTLKKIKELWPGSYITKVVVKDRLVSNGFGQLEVDNTCFVEGCNCDLS